MKNDCLRKCLIEVDLDKFYTAFINNGITSCDLLTKVSLDQFSNLGIVQVEDKLKLIELIKIIKSIQLDLIKEYENTKPSKLELKTKDECLLSDDQSRCANKNINYDDKQSKKNVGDDSDDEKVSKLSYKEEIGVCRQLHDYSVTNLECELASQTESDPNYISDSYCNYITDNNKLILANDNSNSKKKNLDEESEYDSEIHWITNSNNQIAKLNVIKSSKSQNKIKNKTFNIRSNGKARYIPGRQTKPDQSKYIKSKFSSPIGQLSNESNPTNSKSKSEAVVVDRKCNGIFSSDEIQLSSTPLKPFNNTLNSSKKARNIQKETNTLQLSIEQEQKGNSFVREVFGVTNNSQPTIDQIGTLNNSRLFIGCTGSSSKSNLLEIDPDLMQIEVLSGHIPLFNRNKRSLNIQLPGNLSNTKSNANDIDKYALNESNEYTVENFTRRRNTYDKTTDKFIHSKCLDIFPKNELNISQNIAQDIFSQTKSNIDEARRNVHQIMTSNNLDLQNHINPPIELSDKLSIQAPNNFKNDKQLMELSVNIEEIHSDNSTYFKPIKSSPITTITQLTNEEKSSLEQFIVQESKFHPIIISSENLSEKVNDLDISYNNNNINSNKFTLENKDFHTYSSSVFSSNKDSYHTYPSNNNCGVNTNGYYDNNNDSPEYNCAECLEGAHEKQLNDVTNLSYLEMQTLIQYKKQCISVKEYLERIKPMLETKMNCISNLLLICNHFQHTLCQQ